MTARILVIEDNPDNMELMAYLLQAFGHTPLTAEDGEQGLGVACRERPDLIICDIHLPKMDGYQVLRGLKADAVSQSIPIVAVTALAMVGDREKMLAAGFDGYIAKPIAPETFISQVEAFLRPEQRSSTGTTTQEDSTAGNGLSKQEEEAAKLISQPKDSSAADGGTALLPPSCLLQRHEVLIIDDSAVNRELLKATLEPLGFVAAEAASVREALELARQKHYNLFLCDLHMPDEDGWDFLQAVKADPKSSDIPLIILTSSIWSEADKARAYALGASRFLVRPIETERLLQEIASCLAEA